eukprot:g30539.t1
MTKKEGLCQFCRNKAVHRCLQCKGHTLFCGKCWADKHAGDTEMMQHSYTKPRFSSPRAPIKKVREIQTEGLTPRSGSRTSLLHTHLASEPSPVSFSHTWHAHSMPSISSIPAPGSTPASSRQTFSPYPALARASSSDLPVLLSDLPTLEDDAAEQAFKVFDRDGDGLISLKEFTSALQTLGEELEELEVKFLMEEFSKEKDGFLTFKEWLAMMETR